VIAVFKKLLFGALVMAAVSGCKSNPYCLNCKDSGNGVITPVDMLAEPDDAGDGGTVTLPDMTGSGGPCVPTNGGVEICDGLDNDCDGVADMNPICPSGLGCKEGRCTILCTPGEFPCPNGYKCVGDYCVPQRCAGKTCPTDQRCDENTGSCVDLCASVVCNAPKICQHGLCVDCYTLGCAAGQMCNAGVCQTDKCAGVNCGANQYCDNGSCVDLCTANKCSSSQRCIGGACMTDTCATTPCAGGQFCDQNTGQCRIDTCAVTQCGRGQRCIQETGVCEADPCNTVNCPGPCWVCAVTTDGMASCQVSGDCREVSAQIGIKGGGDGCGCAVGDTSSNPSSLALMVAVVGLCGTFTSKRRRRR
jgi:hypothetical protein